MFIVPRCYLHWYASTAFLHWGLSLMPPTTGRERLVRFVEYMILEPFLLSLVCVYVNPIPCALHQTFLPRFRPALRCVAVVQKLTHICPFSSPIAIRLIPKSPPCILWLLALSVGSITSLMIRHRPASNKPVPSGDNCHKPNKPVSPLSCA